MLGDKVEEWDIVQQNELQHERSAIPLHECMNDLFFYYCFVCLFVFWLSASTQEMVNSVTNGFKKKQNMAQKVWDLLLSMVIMKEWLITLKQVKKWIFSRLSFGVWSTYLVVSQWTGRKSEEEQATGQNSPLLPGPSQANLSIAELWSHSRRSTDKTDAWKECGL